MAGIIVNLFLHHSQRFFWAQTQKISLHYRTPEKRRRSRISKQTHLKSKAKKTLLPTHQTLLLHMNKKEREREREREAKQKAFNYSKKKTEREFRDVNVCVYRSGFNEILTVNFIFIFVCVLCYKRTYIHIYQQVVELPIYPVIVTGWSGTIPRA